MTVGLDVSAYRQLRPAPEAKLDTNGEPLDFEYFVRFGAGQAWAEGHWPGRAAPIALGVYSFTERFDFRAGSYSGYGEWRRTLRRVRPDLNAFQELIEFADNEGTLGTYVAAKLHRDFVSHRQSVLALVPEPERQWFAGSYALWATAFLIAADGGAVELH